MAGSLQPRVKTWVSTEDVTYSDLNAEFDNVLLAMQPLLMDDYSTDTRGDYTYTIGASSGLSVSGGNLTNADATQKLFVPTALAARKALVAKLQVTIPGAGASAPGLALKVVDNDDHVYCTLDTSTGEFQIWKGVAGVFTKVDSQGGLTVRQSLYILGGCQGDAFWANLYTADPETTAAAPLAAVSADITDASIRGNVAGKPGIESYLAATTTFSEFKVWEIGGEFNL